MAEYDPTSTLEYKQHDQLFERLRLWKQKASAIPTPEEALRLEKANWATKKRAAREEARRCVLEGPEALTRFDKAADRENDYAAKLATLEDRYGYQAEAQAERYRQRYAKMQRKYGVSLDLMPEEDLRLPSSSPPPSSTQYSSARGRTPPPSDATGDDAAEAPISPPPSGSFPPGAAGDNRDGGPSSERDHCGHGVERASQAGPSSSATEANIIVEGEGNAADNARSAAGGARVANNKRKAADSSLTGTSKRQRPNEKETDPTITAAFNNDGQVEREVEPEHEPDSNSVSGSEGETNPNPADDRDELPRFASQRSIGFEDVYQGGNGQYKHYIAIHKGTFYIIRCDACEMHFGINPLKGGGRHLDAEAHRHMCRVHDVVVETLGIEVLNCNGERQAVNNAAFRMALRDGYRVHGRRYAAHNQNPQTQQPATAASSTTTTSTTNTANTTGTRRPTNIRRRNARAADEAVLSPVPGQIYIAYWNGPVRVGVIVLPRGDCFGDPSFGEVGLSGSSLAEDTDLMTNVPECYRTTPEPKRITGWQEGYEDGGERVRGRKYPVMYFDGIEGFRKGSVMWIEVGDLREYDREDYVGNGGLIENCTHLRQFEKERERAGEIAAGRQAGDPTVEDSRSETSEPELPDYTPPLSPPRPTGAVEPEPLPDITAPSVTGRASSEPRDRPMHRNGEWGSAVPDPARLGRLTSPQTHNTFPTSSRIRPTPENIVGHAATIGEGVPPHHRSDQAVDGGRPAGPVPEGVHSTASAATNRSRGPYDALGSENAALISHLMPYGVHAAWTASTRALGSEVAPSSPPSQRHTGSAATVDLSGLRPGTTTSHSLAWQDQVNGQAGPSARVAPPVPPHMCTPGTPPHPHRSGDTRDSAIVMDDTEQPPTGASYGLAKRTRNGLSPFRRSFDHKPVIPQDTTPRPQPRPSAAQPGGRGPSQQETAWMTAALRSMSTAPEADMGFMPDPSDIDFDAYI